MISSIGSVKKGHKRFTRYTIDTVLNVNALRAVALTAVFKVPFELRCAVLVGVNLEEAGSIFVSIQLENPYGLAVQCPELCGHDFEEVLEHVL